MEKITKECKAHGVLAIENMKVGIYRGKRYIKCRFCENERARAYTKRKYNDPEFVKKKHERDKKRWEEKKEEITKKRQQPEALEKRRNAYHRNLDKYREECREKQQRYRDNLHTHYIKKIIKNDDKTIKFSAIPKEMVDLKRAIMQLKKGIKTNLSVGKLENRKKYK